MMGVCAKCGRRGRLVRVTWLAQAITRQSFASCAFDVAVTTPDGWTEIRCHGIDRDGNPAEERLRLRPPTVIGICGAHLKPGYAARDARTGVFYREEEMAAPPPVPEPVTMPGGTVTITLRDPLT